MKQREETIRWSMMESDGVAICYSCSDVHLLFVLFLQSQRENISVETQMDTQWSLLVCPCVGVKACKCDAFANAAMQV